MGCSPNPESGDSDINKEQVSWFHGWCSKTGYSLDYWEVLVTHSHLIFCRSGESYNSLLLKADMGATHRDRLPNLETDKVIQFDERNFTVPISSLQAIELRKGSRIKKSSLYFEWTDDDITLYKVAQTPAVEITEKNLTQLLSDDIFPEVRVEVSDHQFRPLSSILRILYSRL